MLQLFKKLMPGRSFQSPANSRTKVFLKIIASTVFGLFLIGAIGYIVFQGALVFIGHRIMLFQADTTRVKKPNHIELLLPYAGTLAQFIESKHRIESIQIWIATERTHEPKAKKRKRLLPVHDVIKSKLTTIDFIETARSGCELSCVIRTMRLLVKERQQEKKNYSPEQQAVRNKQREVLVRNLLKNFATYTSFRQNAIYAGLDWPTRNLFVSRLLKLPEISPDEADTLTMLVAYREAEYQKHGPSFRMPYTLQLGLVDIASHPGAHPIHGYNWMDTPVRSLLERVRRVLGKDAWDPDRMKKQYSPALLEKSIDDAFAKFRRDSVLVQVLFNLVDTNSGKKVQVKAETMEDLNQILRGKAEGFEYSVL